MKKKLKIQELKIQSFITELDSSSAKTAKGGSDTAAVCSAISAVTVAATVAVSSAYSVVAKAKSWWPYNESTECTKITTTTTTTTHYYV